MNDRTRVMLSQWMYRFGCVTLFITIVSALHPGQAQACDCYMPENATEALERATAVFTGEVIMMKEETINGENYDVVLMDVSETWKGIQDSQVKIYTDWGSCQFRFEEGNQYLLYPYEHKGKWQVIDCGRSTEIQHAQDDLVELGEGSAPTHMVQLEDTFIADQRSVGNQSDEASRSGDYRTNVVLIGVAIIALLVLFRVWVKHRIK